MRKPEVILTEENGVTMEPLEEVYIEIPEEYYGEVHREVVDRKGEMASTESENGFMKIIYNLRTRNLIGLKRILLTTTKGNLVMHSQVVDRVPYEESASTNPNGRLVSMVTGKVLAYSLNTIQERGMIMVDPNSEVYEGMIIGVAKAENDILVNPTKGREKSNVRMATDQVTDVNLKGLMTLTIEGAIGMLKDDEILEVTPESLRMRKKYLTKQARFEAEKRAKKA